MMYDWIGKANREIETTPVLIFRELLQQLGLLRKYKGTLRLTKVGTVALTSAEALWDVLVGKLVTDHTGFGEQAALLTLAYAATSAGAEIPLDAVATALGHLGWQTSSGRPIAPQDLYHIEALQVLENVTSEQSSWHDRRRISPAAAALAHATLRRA